VVEEAKDDGPFVFRSGTMVGNMEILFGMIGILNNTPDTEFVQAGLHFREASSLRSPSLH